MSLATSGKRRDALSGAWFGAFGSGLVYIAKNFALRLAVAAGTSAFDVVSITDTTGAVVVFTLARSTHTGVCVAEGATHARSTSPAQSVAIVAGVHAVVVTFGPVGPRGDSQIDTTYA